MAAVETCRALSHPASVPLPHVFFRPSAETCYPPPPPLSHPVHVLMFIPRLFWVGAQGTQACALHITKPRTFQGRLLATLCCGLCLSLARLRLSALVADSSLWGQHFMSYNACDSKAIAARSIPVSLQSPERAVPRLCERKGWVPGCSHHSSQTVLKGSNSWTGQGAGVWRGWAGLGEHRSGSPGLSVPDSHWQLCVCLLHTHWL